ncbi:MAG TPA: hypothetical protein VEK07_03480 [Polyangiaceae bacterium]|nr:hypothetical protein [Polyangiaceae bacterium]
MGAVLGVRDLLGTESQQRRHEGISHAAERPAIAPFENHEHGLGRRGAVLQSLELYHARGVLG